LWGKYKELRRYSDPGGLLGRKKIVESEVSLSNEFSIYFAGGVFHVAELPKNEFMFPTDWTDTDLPACSICRRMRKITGPGSG
jgi:hypothetical protein